MGYPANPFLGLEGFQGRFGLLERVLLLKTLSRVESRRGEFRVGGGGKEMAAFSSS